MENKEIKPKKISLAEYRAGKTEIKDSEPVLMSKLGLGLHLGTVEISKNIETVIYGDFDLGKISQKSWDLMNVAYEFSEQGLEEE
ncbi:MAG: hypothetical protein Q4E36_03380 [Bacillota bacterium]|nr:hypothetical protein [Bacillota bacterium]